MTDITKATVSQLSDLLAAKKISAVEIIVEYFKRIDKHDPELGTFLHLDKAGAIAQAEAADKMLAAGMGTPLTGIPVGIKDVLIQKGLPHTCGSRILEGFVPQFDGTVVARLREAGAVFPGKINCDEFAMGSSNEYSAFKPVRNPWDKERIPGGSSGGSAAAVSARLCPAALGTDTGGSIRQPASMCGIVGIKPTYGRVSRFGLTAFGSSLDTIGPMTRSVKDAAIILQVIAGEDEKDSTSLKAPVDDYLKNIEGGIRGLKIGVLPEMEGLHQDVQRLSDAALDHLRAAGAEIVEISLPSFKYAIPTYYIIACAEASSNLARYDGIRYGMRNLDIKDLMEHYLETRSLGFGPEVKRRIMLGTFVLSSGYYDAYYSKACKVRELIRQDVVKAFKEVDLIATPTAPDPAWKIGEKADDPIKMYLADIFTSTFNLAGVPGISLNCGYSNDNLPIGFQLIAPHLQEALLLRGAYALEASLGLVNQGPIE